MGRENWPGCERYQSHKKKIVTSGLVRKEMDKIYHSIYNATEIAVF